MYNRLYEYLVKNNILYKKQFGFQRNHSTEHAILQLVEDISNSFNNGEYTLGVFINLSKASDTVDHKILLEKLSIYFFRNYLSNRRQYIYFDENNHTNPLTIIC